FFSNRRRHTRWPRDWSSDVCSSDLRPGVHLGKHGGAQAGRIRADSHFQEPRHGGQEASGGRRGGESRRRRTRGAGSSDGAGGARSEERRVGKEGSARCTPKYEEDKK